MSINDLPTEQLFQILLNAPPEDIPSFCRTRREYSEICRSEAFWKQKALRDFGEPLIPALTPYQRYMKMKRTREIDEDSWEITLPFVYKYIDLFANNPGRIHELIDFWFHYPNNLMSDPGLMGMLARWNEDLQRSNITVKEIKEGINEGLLNQLEDGPSINDLLYGNYPERWGSDPMISEDALYPEGMDADQFTQLINGITYRSNPEVYEAIWKYLEGAKSEIEYDMVPLGGGKFRLRPIGEVSRRIPLDIYDIIQRAS